MILKRKIISQNKTAKKYLAEFVYGATDGTVTTFAIIAGAIGASLGSGIILVLGFANLLADGFSMAISNYLSTKSQKDMLKQEYSGKSPIKTALATFLSFVAIGFIPLSAFVFSSFSQIIQENKFLISAIMTGIAFSVIGCIKGVIIEKKPILSGIESLLIGGVAAFIAFIVGFMLKNLV